ncbi:MAG: LysM domain-containing protein [Parcubacteria group bacterium]|jgi:LysM repeat protein
MMKRHIYIGIIFIFLAPHVVCATEDAPIRVFVDDKEANEITRDYAVGSSHNMVVRIENQKNVKQDIAIFIEDAEHNHATDENGKSLVKYTRFYSDPIDQKYAEILKQNNNDIVAFCAKNSDKVGAWCDGVAVAHVTIPAGEKVDVPVTVHLADEEIDHEVYVVVQDGKEFEGSNDIKRITLRYHVPDKNITKMQLDRFGMHKEFIFGDFGTWMRAGFRDDYIAEFVSQNIGTEDVHYTDFVNVESVWIGEVVSFSDGHDSKEGEKNEDNVHVTMPRFGKVRVVGGIAYADSNGQPVEIKSESMEFIIWPVRFLIIIFGGICFCVICVLLYKYIRKNMFGFKKNKKDEKQFAGTYTVQDTDNIISIAQAFDVPWKDLAQYNKIDAPYILISGETIHVPGPQPIVAEKENEQEQTTINHESPIHSDVDAHKTMASDQEELLNAVKKNNPTYVSKGEPIRSMQSTAHMQKDPSIIQRENHEPMKRKVTFATPQSMLTQPASEPTTRAIDIEWMRDDEEAYNEEMEFQRKEVNKRLIIIVAVVACAIGGIVVWGVMQWMQRDTKEKISVETLIEGDAMQNQSDGNMALPQNDATQSGTSDEQDTKTVVTEEQNTDVAKEMQTEQAVQSQENQKAPKDITVQVLNAGGVTGAAAAVSKDFKDKEYMVKAAQNSQNSYSGVIIYYTAEMKDHVDTISQIVAEKYGTQKKEESSDVTGKYKSDIVVVLGT